MPSSVTFFDMFACACVYVGCYLYLLDVKECFIQVTYKLQMREGKMASYNCVRASRKAAATVQSHTLTQTVSVSVCVSERVWQ